MKAVRKVFNNQNLLTRTIFNSPKQLQHPQHAENVEEQTPKTTPLTQLTQDEIIMKDTVAKLAREQIAPHVREMENEEKITPTILKQLFENGLMGLEVDPSLGGVGANFMTTIVTVEELSKVDPSVAALVDIHSTLCVSFLNKLGTKEQKEKYLTRIATDTVCSFALTEPSSGTDAFSLKTTAKKDGTDYIINGSKMWISNSDLAGLFIVFANANPADVSLSLLKAPLTEIMQYVEFIENLLIALIIN